MVVAATVEEWCIRQQMARELERAESFFFVEMTAIGSNRAVLTLSWLRPPKRTARGLDMDPLVLMAVACLGNLQQSLLSIVHPALRPVPQAPMSDGLTVNAILTPLPVGETSMVESLWLSRAIAPPKAMPPLSDALVVLTHVVPLNGQWPLQLDLYLVSRTKVVDIKHRHTSSNPTRCTTQGPLDLVG